MTETTEPNTGAGERELAPFDLRVREMLARIFRGMRHVRSFKRESGHYAFTCIAAQLSTYDFDTLTRIVIAAHEYCIRVELRNGGPGAVKLRMTDRKRTGDSYDRHPTIEEAIEKWNAR